MEERRGRIADKIETELKELESIIKSLEILSARIEVSYITGEISKEIYEKKSEAFNSGINLLKDRFEDAEKMLKMLTEGSLPSREDIKKILSEVPVEKAFYFYTNYGDYAGKYARSLEEFATIIKNIEKQSIRFHLTREDFQTWISDLGDHELAERLDSLKKLDLSDESLRGKIQSCVNERIMGLKRILSILTS